MAQHAYGAPRSRIDIKPRRGRWKSAMVNLLLRLSVKSRQGLHINIAKLRDQFGKLNQQASPALLADVQRDDVSCNGVAAQWLTPKGCQRERVLLYIHGGAFVASTPDIYAAMMASWCKPMQARALMVEYRLAPEHPHPTALNECLEAYRWLLDQGIEPRNIVIAGDSAGGNLALATLQRLRAWNKPLPSCSVLLSPFLDFTLSGASALDNAVHDPIFTLPFAVGIRGFYARAESLTCPEVSPLFGDFSGLPPLLLQVGSTEMLLDDAVRAAARAETAGCNVRLEVWERLPHVFQMISALPQADEAAQNIRSFIATYTSWDGG